VQVHPDHYRRNYDLQRANAEHFTRRYRSLVWQWIGQAFRPPATAAAAPLPSVAPGQVGTSFAGHSTLLVRYANLAIACDPMLSSWFKVIRRAVRPGLSPAELGEVDLVLISHGHGDHLHRPTLAKLPRSATVVVPPRTAHMVSDLGFARVLELGVGKSVMHRNVDIWTAPVRHDDRVPGLAYVIRGDGPSVYFCGDSGYFSGFAEVGKRFRPDIALLPIGGFEPAPFRDRHMSPLDALYALEDLGARVLVPHHHGAFALSYEELDEPGRWLQQLVSERGLEGHVAALAPGESRLFAHPEPDPEVSEPGSPTPEPGTPPEGSDVSLGRGTSPLPPEAS
jgi:L-ascorbate metabolism protein UlaG (beta-lactamase superfamily)